MSHTARKNARNFLIALEMKVRDFFSFAKNSLVFFVFILCSFIQNFVNF